MPVYNNYWSKEAINYIVLTEKRNVKCEMFESSAFLSFFVMETEERQLYDSYII